MVAAGPKPPTAEVPFPNVPLIHRPGTAEAPRPSRARRSTRLLMFGHIADGVSPSNKRDPAGESADDRVPAKFVRLLKRLRFA